MYACTDVVLMIEPPAGMCGRAFLHSQNIPYRLVRMTRSNWSVEMAEIPSGWDIW